MADLLLATAILLIALFPIAYSFSSEKRVALSYYQRAVAMEIVDGEMETLVAGGWRNYAIGTHEYPVSAGAATNLSPGQFFVTVQTNHVRLEWRPAAKHHGGAVVREAIVK